ncbi:MAG: peptidoglycan DD-metalloendopeptidase family protein [Eubacteriaceae bacterium]|nr:peptidoglycan DD-metalloendopeptidase family protein [Eubacteriaceae bacterium]
MKRKIISLLLAIVLMLSFIPASAGAATLDELKNNLNSIEDKQENTIKLIDANKATIDELLNEVNRLDAEMAKYEASLKEIEVQISDIQKQLELVQAELVKAEAEKKQYKDTLDERVRVMYMFGDSSYLEILFSSENFSDLISKVDMIKTVIDYDKEIFAKLEAVEKEIALKKLDIETKKNDIVTKQRETLTKRNQLNQTKVAREGYVKELNTNTQKLNEQLDRLEQESNKIKNEIVSKQTINTQINSKYRWPSPGATTITSPFGYRIHPILGYTKFHSGIDISTGRRTGVNAIAVGSGIVIQSDYTSGGYGNKVIIDLGLDEKGNKISAVYAHLAKRYVAVGKVVDPGTPIGEIGTTGLSTGIHLHFEIRVNGVPVDPLGYVRP